jgi:EF-hand domain pair
MFFLPFTTSTSKRGEIMVNGICGSSGYATQMQMQGITKRQGSEERFNKLDTDGNTTIDQTELQTVADTFSEITGQQMNVEEVTATYDADNDGQLGRDEMQSMMMGLRDQMGGPQRGLPPSQQLLSAYQMDPENDLTSSLMDMFGEQDEDQEAYSPVNIQA